MAAGAAEVGLPLRGSSNDREVTAEEFGEPNFRDLKSAVNQDGNGMASVLGPPGAADGGFGVGNIVSAVDADGGQATSGPERSGRVVPPAGAARAAGSDDVSPAEGENQLGERSTAGVEHRQGVVAQGDGQPLIHLKQHNRHLVSSSTSHTTEPSRGGAATETAATVTTPFEGPNTVSLQSREPSADCLSVGSMPSSVGEEKEDGDMDSGNDAEPVLSGEEPTSKKHRRERNDGRSGGRKSHKHKHKRSRRHRDKSSDEGASKSRRRRSKDHGVLESTSASTITALAPLKRIPPPLSSSAQRAIDQGEEPVGEAASVGDSGGISGGVGGG